MQILLILRLFSAVFLTLVGVVMIFVQDLSMSRLLGAFIASIGLTALNMVWLGSRTR
jgi:hypothetical protein